MAERSGYRHNEYFTKAIKKYGWDNITHVVLCDGLTAKEADEMERTLIGLLKSNRREYGYNLTGGGEIGKTLSEESRRKISEKNKGHKTRLGAKHTESAKKKMSDAHKGKTMPESAMEKCWAGRRVPVAQFSKSGEKIAEHISTAEAARTGCGNVSNIVACAKGKRKSAFGYLWRYVEGTSDEHGN